jgi:uncharacterized membrane protein
VPFLWLNMKIPLKYGLMIAAGLIAWVLIAHSVVTNPASLVHSLGGPIFFNLLHFVMIYLGLKELERRKGDRPTFKEGLKTGVAISFVYALTASLFFAGVMAVIGTRWLESEPGAAGKPTLLVAIQAFAGLFLGGMILGLIYSTLISFFLAKRQSEA